MVIYHTLPLQAKCIQSGRLQLMSFRLNIMKCLTGGVVQHAALQHVTQTSVSPSLKAPKTLEKAIALLP